ncbi:ribonuclease D [Elusimicrobiota bacterium]
MAILITSEDKLKDLVIELSNLDSIALDTESNSFYVYREELCLLQVSTKDADYIIDTLAIKDLNPLNDLFSRKRPEKVFHSAEADIRVIKGAGAFQFINIFDIMTAARMAGWKDYGLAPLLLKYFGIKLDKKHQLSNWGKRPLSEEQLDYASKDTQYLLQLKDKLLPELKNKDMLEEAMEEFAQIAEIEPSKREFNPEGFRSIRGAKDLSQRSLTVLRELYLYREEEARTRNKPTFKILPDFMLVRIAQKPVKSFDSLKAVHQMTPYQLKYYSNGVLRAIAHAEKAEPAPLLLPKNNNGKSPNIRRSKLATEIYDNLRAWRNDIAETRKMDASTIISNKALKCIAYAAPKNMETLANVPELNKWKCARYGESMLKIIRSSIK